MISKLILESRFRYRQNQTSFCWNQIRQNHGLVVEADGLLVFLSVYRITRRIFFGKKRHGDGRVGPTFLNATPEVCPVDLFCDLIGFGPLWVSEG